jgi:GNAT superfamily N-acetyltransferase
MAVALVRPANSEDVDEIVRIQGITWRTAYTELVPEAALERLSGPAAHHAWTAAVTFGAGYHVLVATEGEWTVGFCAVGPARIDEPEAPEDLAQIVALLVEPRWGRRGHGRRLLDAAFRAAAEDGATSGMAWVPEADLASRACYDRIGWEPDGTLRTLDAGDRPLREMRLAGPLRIEERRRPPAQP